VDLSMSPDGDTGVHLPESSRRATLIEIFKLFDVNRSGGIAVNDELKYLRRSVDHKEGEWIKGGRNAHLITELDANGDGVVDREEFAAFFMKSFPPQEEPFNRNAANLREVGEQLKITLKKARR